MKEIICPFCGETVEIPEKKFGQPSPACPECGKQIIEWFDDYNADFRVAGGTGAQREGRKRFGGHRNL